MATFDKMYAQFEMKWAEALNRVCQLEIIWLIIFM